MVVHVTVRNIGKAKWLASNEPHGGVALGCHLLDAEGRLVELEHGPRADLPVALEPGQEASFDAVFPPLEAGLWILELDCVAEHVTWFGQTGSTPARLVVDVPMSSRA